MTELAISADGGVIATAGGAGAPRLWDAKTGALIRVLESDVRRVEGLAFSPDGARLLVGSDYDIVEVWDVAGGARLLTLKGHEGWVRAIYSPDGARIATGSMDDTARIWDAETGQWLLLMRGHESAITDLAFSPDGTRLITASMDGAARVWDAETSEPLLVLSGHEDTVWHVGYSLDGALIYTLERHALRLWDASAGDPLWSFSLTESLRSEGRLRVAAFGSDSALIAVGGVGLWVMDAQTGSVVATLEGHTETVWDLAFSPDGKRLATAAFDETVRIWDVARGAEIAVLRGHSENLYALEYAPDGRWVLTGGEDAAARIWPLFLSVDEAVEAAKAAVPRCLTPEERERFFLPPEPPRWCVTGAGREDEPDPSKWTPKWPYQSEVWRDWLRAKDRGDDPALPTGSE